MIAFRMVLIFFMGKETHDIPFFKSYARIIATMLAASINAILIEVGLRVQAIIDLKMFEY